MAAVGGHPAQGGGTGKESAPIEFRDAVEALAGARLRPEIELSPAPAPRRMAPFAYALTATVEVDGEELADGRLVLLYDPAGQDAWNGEFRLVSMTRAELEPEMAGDPMLSDVGWAWLTDALDAHGAGYVEPSGTVTRCASQYFGGLGEREPSTEIEIRASWNPGRRPVRPAPVRLGRPALRLRRTAADHTGAALAARRAVTRRSGPDARAAPSALPLTPRALPCRGVSGRGAAEHHPQG